MATVYNSESSRRVSDCSDEVLEENWNKAIPKTKSVCSVCNKEPYNNRLINGVCASCKRKS